MMVDYSKYKKLNTITAKSICEMALSHVSRRWTVRENLDVERIANMTSSESNSSNAIEVDGIRFETLVPEQTVYLPKYGEETPIQFGVRITNQTSTPYRFDLPHVLPEMLDPQGHTMQMDLNKNATREVEEFDIPLIIPGKSLDFLMNAKFSWYNKNCLRLLGNASYGGIWIFWNFKPSKYQVRFTYESYLAKKKMITLKEGRTEIDSFWTGKIMTYFADIRLR
ncbi:hypothetical protein F7734_15535 [Scytonema sp. UIC 10036]|uniref:hypothetical protein n=1 Tax=Scytonema sp. UIC 10036 TaxID=2304196 RepID=UPI0012DA8D23|nr:hypothetical protein [Scytonema sp. UIC 10036]MUG93752.1 hypothetical protein [Scytonema sp. UIC 10036]